MLMKAGDRDDDDLRWRWFVDDAVRKADHLATTDVSAQRMPSQRKFLYSLNCGPSFLSELDAQIGSLQIVVMDRDSEF